MAAPPLSERVVCSGVAWAPAVRAVLESVGSTITKAMYRKAIEDFLLWLEQQGSPTVTGAAVQSHLAYLESVGYAAATLNQRLSAIRKLAAEAANSDLLPLDQAVQVCRIPNVRQAATLPATSLSKQKSEDLINAPDNQTNRGKRDRVLLALLVGCALRRREVVNLDVEDIQYEDGRGVIIRVVGQRGRIRSIAIPDWVEEALAQWLSAVKIASGPILRAVSRRGEIASDHLSPQTVFNIVRQHGQHIGVAVRPDDLRRTCAKLCHPGDGELDQIRALLGHSSLATTERYLCGRENVATVASERVHLRWKQAS